eukprot:902596-Prymnesium_polylepis.2
MIVDGIGCHGATPASWLSSRRQDRADLARWGLNVRPVKNACPAGVGQWRGSCSRTSASSPPYGASGFQPARSEHAHRRTNRAASCTPRRRALAKAARLPGGQRPPHPTSALVHQRVIHPRRGMA